MKKYIAISILAALLISGVHAGDETEYKSYDNGYKTAVIDNSLDFEAEREGYEVELSWDEYNGDDFKYYKIMRSTKTDNPIYPEQNAIGVYDNQEKTEFYHKNWDQSLAYYRVCVIRTDNARTCSNVVKLEGFDKTEEKKYEEKEYKEKSDTITKKYYQEKATTQKEQKKQVVKTVKKGLDKNLENRADKLVNNMVSNLDSRFGDDVDGKIEKLEDIITKLDTIKSKAKGDTIIILIDYLIDSINEHIEEYQASDDIEEIFNLLGE